MAQFRVERVQAGGTIEGDHGDAIIALYQYCVVVAHELLRPVGCQAIAPFCFNSLISCSPKPIAASTESVSCPGLGPRAAHDLMAYD